MRAPYNEKPAKNVLSDIVRNAQFGRLPVSPVNDPRQAIAHIVRAPQRRVTQVTGSSDKGRGG